jgi:hypothetical protein
MSNTNLDELQRYLIDNSLIEADDLLERDIVACAMEALTILQHDLTIANQQLDKLDKQPLTILLKECGLVDEAGEWTWSPETSPSRILAVIEKLLPIQKADQEICHDNSMP